MFVTIELSELIPLIILIAIFLGYVLYIIGIIIYGYILSFIEKIKGKKNDKAS